MIINCEQRESTHLGEITMSITVISPEAEIPRGNTFYLPLIRVYDHLENRKAKDITLRYELMVIIVNGQVD